MNTSYMVLSSLDEAEQTTIDDIESGFLPPHWLTEIDHLILRNLECAEDPEDPDVLSWAYIKNLNT